MGQLKATVIDVGWGDSILLEYEVEDRDTRFALIDCNDRPNEKSSYLFVKRHMQTIEVDWTQRKPLFDFVLLTHGHDDHARGLKYMLSRFGTDWYWYPKSNHGGASDLLRYANRAVTKVARHQAIDQTKTLPDFGDVRLKALWPPHDPTGPYDLQNENNNSVVLLLTLDAVSFVLTGDCEADNWGQIVGSLPANVKAFQVPHHGAHNGVFDAGRNVPWLSSPNVAPGVELVMSSHISPYKHPDSDVLGELDNRGYTYYRTDKHHHVTFSTDGTKVERKWSHW